MRQFARAEAALREPTSEEQTALDEMKLRETELDAEGQAMSEGDTWSADNADRIDLEEQDIAARRAAIQDARRTWAPDVKERAGVIVTIGREGDAQIIHGLLRAADQKGASVDARRATKAISGAVSARARDESKKAVYSEPLVRRLTAHKTVALQVALSRNVSVALVALTHALAQKVFGEERVFVRSALQLTAQLPAHELVRAADDLEDSKAWVTFAADKRTWAERLPGKPDELLVFLGAMPQPQLLDLLAFCVASSASAMSQAERRPEADALATALSLDMADWWEPDAKGFLSHLSKAQIVEAMKEGAPGSTDDGVAALKKDVLVVKAASRLQGKRWLPALLRPRPMDQ